MTSAAYKEDVPVRIYLPHGFDRSERHPLIVMPQRRPVDRAREIVGILDRLFETRANAAIVALVPIQGWVGEAGAGTP